MSLQSFSDSQYESQQFIYNFVLFYEGQGLSVLYFKTLKTNINTDKYINFNDGNTYIPAQKYTRDKKKIINTNKQKKENFTKYSRV